MESIEDDPLNQDRDTGRKRALSDVIEIEGSDGDGKDDKRPKLPDGITPEMVREGLDQAILEAKLKESEEDVRLDIDLPPMEEEEKVSEDNILKKICSLCEEREIITAFVACGHAVTCLKCLYNVVRSECKSGQGHKCPICRNEYIMVIRLKYATGDTGIIGA